MTSTTTKSPSTTTPPRIRIVRRSEKPLQKSPKHAMAKLNYQYSLDNDGSIEAKEAFDGRQTQGQYKINRSGFLHKTFYSVTPDSGFQADSSYSIFEA